MTGRKVIGSQKCSERLTGSQKGSTDGVQPGFTATEKSH